VLQALVRVRDAALQRHIGCKKSFGFLDLPHGQLGMVVHQLLKKKRHDSEIQNYFAGPANQK
jgi:hypothetical protein